MWQGNRAADQAAKQAAQRALPPDLKIQEVLAATKQAIGLYRAIGKMLAHYPHARDTWGVLARARQTSSCARVREKPTPHKFQWHAHKQLWVCAVCARYKRCGRSPLDSTSCNKPSPTLAAFLSDGDSGNHLLYVSNPSQGPPLYFCKRCGAYAQHKALSLIDECGQPHDRKQSSVTTAQQRTRLGIGASGKRSLRRIQTGWHPIHFKTITMSRPQKVVLLKGMSMHAGDVSVFGSLGSGCAVETGSSASVPQAQQAGAQCQGPRPDLGFDDPDLGPDWEEDEWDLEQA